MTRAKSATKSATTTRGRDHGPKLVSPTPVSPAEPSTGPRFVEMIRVSTKGQADRDTPELQRLALDRLRERRPGILVERIEALGLSGASPFDERPDLHRLLELARERAFDEVRVYALDRLTRAYDADERWDIWGWVRKAGAVIVDANDNVIDPADRSGASEYRFFFEGQNAAAEHRKIGERTMAGRLRAAAQGRFPGGAPPFGLRWDKKAAVWIELHDQIAVVRDIFLWSADGESTGRIAARLNATGVLSSKRTRWHAGVVGKLLRNRAYLGEFTVRVDGEPYPLVTPTIIDPELFERAQAGLTDRKHKPSRPDSPYRALLRGRARCGSCGLKMQTKVGRGGQLSYVCASKHAYHQDKSGGPSSCPRHNHRADRVDQAVWESIRALLEAPDLLREAAAGAEAKVDDRTLTVDSIDDKLAALVRHEGEVMQWRKRGTLSAEAATAELESTAQERKTLEREKKQTERRAAARDHAALDAMTIEERVKGIANGLTNADFDTRREFVLALVPDGDDHGFVIYDDDRIEMRGLLDLGLPAPEADAPKVTPRWLTPSA